MNLETEFKQVNQTPMRHLISLLNVFLHSPKMKKTRHLFTQKMTGTDKCLSEKLLSDMPLDQALLTQESCSVQHPIRLEMSIEKINELLKHQQIYAADIRCLDSGSKQCLMKLCLQNCLTGK